MYIQLSWFTCVSFEEYRFFFVLRNTGLFWEIQVSFEKSFLLYIGLFWTITTLLGGWGVMQQTNQQVSCDVQTSLLFFLASLSMCIGLFWCIQISFDIYKSLLNFYHTSRLMSEWCNWRMYRSRVVYIGPFCWSLLIYIGLFAGSLLIYVGLFSGSLLICWLPLVF